MRALYLATTHPDLISSALLTYNWDDGHADFDKTNGYKRVQLRQNDNAPEATVITTSGDEQLQAMSAFDVISCTLRLR